MKKSVATKNEIFRTLNINQQKIELDGLNLVKSDKNTYKIVYTKLMGHSFERNWFLSTQFLVLLNTSHLEWWATSNDKKSLGTSICGHVIVISVRNQGAFFQFGKFHSTFHTYLFKHRGETSFDSLFAFDLGKYFLIYQFLKNVSIETYKNILDEFIHGFENLLHP